MRTRLLRILACPECKGDLRLNVINKESNENISTGLLLCESCKLLYPIYDGVPRMFPYFLEEYKKFIDENKEEIEKQIGYSFPSGAVSKGEESVHLSFSKEWAEYDYDGILWNCTYEQRLKLFLWEVNMKKDALKDKLVFDCGCGNGVISNIISTTGAEVVGMDLSFGVVSATREFASNRYVHFVNGTLFKPPFKPGAFDVVYSHGVLHHTNNTRKAFLAIAPLCRNEGRCYIWVYGNYSGFIWLFNIVTNTIRFIVSRLPLALQNPLVVVLARLYGFARRNFRRYVIKSSGIEYNWTHTLHAARDRFTPLYAHVSNAKEVMEWFREACFPNPVFRPNFFEDPAYEGGIAVYGDRKKSG